MNRAALQRQRVCPITNMAHVPLWTILDSSHRAMTLASSVKKVLPPFQRITEAGEVWKSKLIAGPFGRITFWGALSGDDLRAKI